MALGYRVLEADPPWRFGDPLGKRGADHHYANTLSLDEIKAFPLPPMDPRGSLLFLWRVASMQRAALEVMDAWGYREHSEIVWRKLTPTGKPHFGMGRITRASHEVCLVGVRGKYSDIVASRSIRSVIEAPTGRHSQKPAAFYETIEALTRGPRVRLFARDRRPGWSSLGNEIPPLTKKVIDGVA